MALKLDISKAYDRVEWDCLKKIMEKLGFDVKWRSLIMKCVTTVSYSIKIMGCLGEIFSHLGGSVKETLYHLIYLSYMQRDSHLLLNPQWRMVI